MVYSPKRVCHDGTIRGLSHDTSAVLSSSSRSMELWYGVYMYVLSKHETIRVEVSSAVGATAARQDGRPGRIGIPGMARGPCRSPQSKERERESFSDLGAL